MTIEPSSPGERGYPDVNFADAWEAIAAAIPTADAVAWKGVVTSWADYEDHAARFAAALDAAGIGHDDKVALYLFNRPEYLEAQFGAFKQRAVPCNVNYRYLAEELHYLLDNSDAKAVVVHHRLLDRVLEVWDRLPLLALVVTVGAGPDAVVPEGVVTWEMLMAAHEPAAPIARSAEDLWFLYTGGTTGHPKAVMWPQGALFGTMATFFTPLRLGAPQTVSDVVAAVRAAHVRGRVNRVLAGAPLMHGTSGINAMAAHSLGGLVALLGSESFRAEELFAAVADHQVTMLTIVGDAFCKPMIRSLEEAEAAGKPYDISSLYQVVSSGVVWSAESKAALLKYRALTLVDSLGSSEGVGFAQNITRREDPANANNPKADSSKNMGTARFQLGAGVSVLTEDGQDVVPGSGEVGRLALEGLVPVGYYKAPEKSAETFPVIDGRRRSIPGDYASVETDGTISLLGRGSVSINSGGEKIYPEEVEEALKTHPAVADANAVGMPDEKWGQAVVGVVSLTDDAATDDEIIAHVKTRIASYKAPKKLVRVDPFVRSPNGKSDYTWATETAKDALGL